MARQPTAHRVRRRRIAAVAVLSAIVVAVALVLLSGGGKEAPKQLVPGGGEAAGTYDPLAYDPDREQELQQRAAAGFSDVVYEKSPAGVVASARRVARWRPLVNRAAKANGVDPATLEAIVFLESAGRPDVVAGGDLQGAVGLTQILASTATALLGLHVDLARSRTLTNRIAATSNAKKLRRLERARRRADQRFDPALAIAAAARYLKMAKAKFGRDDLAVATYHMGMGNLESILHRYRAQGGDQHPSYTRLYFDSTPLRKPRAYALLSSLGDDSSTYLWRVRAAQEIMRLSRDEPKQLARLAGLDATGGAGARRLYPNGPPGTTTKTQKPPAWGPALGLRLTQQAKTDYAPDPGTAAVLAYIGAGTRKISGQAPLVVTSAHGVRIEMARRYRSGKQALAFQFMLDRLQAWNLIAWGRGGDTLAIVVGPDAAKRFPAASQLVRDAQRRPSV
ncbi:MAG TPA: transglycosylase SLT domain-containing protein [Thermoleophilaceae bacterium]|nr:transglycosylase SLT domain-containing protein [Thermoleophilaceae bacterium]